MIIIIDNYDSFTYNIYQYVGEFSPNVKVIENDQISLQELKKNNPEKIIISPGPGHPKDSKVSLECIQKLGHSIPMLGICLGHQILSLAFDADTKRMDKG